MKKWECTVCGYIHEGEEPPDECPVCAADKSLFVEVVEEFDATAQVTKDGMTVSGDSIMGLLMLAASRGTSIEVSTSGPAAAALAEALAALVANRFGEEF